MIPKIKKILFANDLSYNSRFAFAHAACLAHCYDARVTVLHVLEEISESADISLGSYFGETKWKLLKKDISQEAIDMLEKRVSRFCREVNEELGAHAFETDDIVVKRGKPVETILQEAKARTCDLIVMGTHGHGGFREAVMGSNSKRVIRQSKIPVLIVPLPG